MKLAYINYIGDDWKGKHLYEFLFSDNLDKIDGDNWDAFPAAGMPQPPGGDFIVRVGKLTSELKFDLIQNSDSFAVWDAVDGLIALGWENITEYEEYPENRLYFKFGSDIKDIEDKLLEKDTVLEYNNIGKKSTNEN